jgi:hypothetical protein
MRLTSALYDVTIAKVYFGVCVTKGDKSDVSNMARFNRIMEQSVAILTYPTLYIVKASIRREYLCFGNCLCL